MRRAQSLVMALPLLALFACGDTPPPQPPPRPAPPPPPVVTASAAPQAPAVKNEDFLWLEDVKGEKALAFARAHNDVSEKALTSDPGFKALEARLFAIYSSKDRIPGPNIQNDVLRNFWTDSEHPRGLWRQTTFADYKKPAPSWTILMDVDALGKEEKESYVWKGSNCLHP